MVPKEARQQERNNSKKHHKKYLSVIWTQQPLLHTKNMLIK